MPYESLLGNTDIHLEVYTGCVLARARNLGLFVWLGKWSTENRLSKEKYI